MEIDEDQQLQQSFSSRLGITRKILLVIVAISFVSRTFSILKHGTYHNLFTISSPFIRIFYFGLLYLIPKVGVFKQKLIIHSLFEMTNLHLLCLGKFYVPQHLYVVGLGACISLLNLQTRLVQNVKISAAIGAKFLLMWFWDLLSELNSSEETLVPFIIIVTSVVGVVVNNKLYNDLETEKAKNYQKIKQTKRKLSVVIKNFPTGMMVLSACDFSVKIVNERILELLECTQENLLRTLETLQYSPNRRFLYQEEENQGLFCDIKKCVLSNEDEFKLGLVSFKNLLLEVNLKKIRWGNEASLLITANDAERILALEKSETQNECKNSLLRSVSHEMRTPIYAIISMANQLQEDQLPPKSAEKVSILGVSSQLLLLLVNDLLDYSKIIANLFRVNLSHFDIRSLLENTLKIIQIQAEKKNIRVLLRIDPLLPETLYSDYSRLEQVITNILNNALKFTVKGFIELSASLTPLNKIKICIKDTGIGIPEERQNSIFGMFSTNEFRSEGCGLGLHITSHIVENLGGTIEVKSEVGKGSEFFFELPMSEGTVEEIPDTSSEDSVPEEISGYIELKHSGVSLGQRTHYSEILIVDDNEFNRIIMGQILGNNGYRYLEAFNGEIAVEMVVNQSKKRQDFKVVIMDCSMPVMDGWEATKRIYELYNSKELNRLPYVIGCSAYSNEEEIKTSYESGMLLHLIKPVKAEVLINTVEYFLNK